MSRRFLLAGPMIFVGVLSAASAQVPDADHDHCAARKPTALDYLALASMADSQRPLAMAAYRPQRQNQPVPKIPQG